MIPVLLAIVAAASLKGAGAAILALLGAVLVYSVVAVVHPVHRCPRCRGERVIKGRRKPRRCGTCKGTGRTRRLAAGPVTRLAWSLAGPALRARLEIRHEELRGKSGYDS
jgi:hypothetical protein